MTVAAKHGTSAQSTQALAPLLAEGAQALGVALDGGQQQRLLDYVALLAKWNAVYNLTAIRDPRQMLVQHVLDSLAIIPHLASSVAASPAPNTAAVLDVGSGGGLPGVVLAIAQPGWQVTVNDIVHKKTAFLTQAKGALALPNLSVATGRVESLRPGIEVAARFDIIVSRAFAELADFVALARHLVADGGALWAMKGVRPDAEIARLPASAAARQVIRLQVPSLDAERHLVEVKVGALSEHSASSHRE
jgi:16S rRNA (guanine527-N7)-methyltransferase